MSRLNKRKKSKSLKSLKIKHKFAEARYHNRIGKVERIIGFIQQILRSYNVQFNNRLVTDHDPELQWFNLVLIKNVRGYQLFHHQC